MSTTKVANISNLAGSKTITTDDLIDRASCQAWVNFNGTGTVAIRASFNVSSITDLGTGYYQINFASAFADDYYAVIAMSRNYDATEYSNENVAESMVTTRSASRVAVTNGYNGTGYDTYQMNVAVFR